ncbi:MAG: FkbM family methyltransferase [Chlamydiales bacterium]|nr:FkbM family methyltransferase [Chlamydiales bacterium]
MIDIGANVGFFTTFFSHFVGSTGQVDAFEANPYVFKILYKRTKRKRNIRCYQVALSEGSKCKLEMYVQPYMLFYCGTVEPDMVTADRFSGKAAKIEVPTLSLDSLPQTPPIKLIKIDAEGHEDTIFKGGHTLLKQARPFVVFEYVCRDNFVAQSPQIISEYGYKCIDIQTMLEFVPSQGERYVTDIIAIPDEHFLHCQPKLTSITELTAH